MQDVAISLNNRPGELARMGEALGRAGVSIEGGAAFVVSGNGVAHFLFADGWAARAALEHEGIRVMAGSRRRRAATAPGRTRPTRQAMS